MADGWNAHRRAAVVLAASACLSLAPLLAGCTGQPGTGPDLPSPAGTTSPGPPPPVAANLAAPQTSSAGRLVGSAAAGLPTTTYYVLLDDGGNHGVRFGCNDSLVALARTGPAAGDALASSVAALLGSPQPAPGTGTAPPGLYNALASSRLTFLSGSFDGTTVTVYLAGTLHPEDPCDAHRIEAQLTQTAVAAVGAIRADIHVNGQSLADALAPKGASP
ncbi:hypothetical protein [Arthrobacter sp. C152]